MNLWTQFNRLVETGGPRYIGEVIDVHSAFGEVRATVELLPGGAELEVSANGRSVSIGQRWVIQDGKMVDEAPAGTVLNVEV